MALPTKMRLTPSATTTAAHGASTDAASEHWQRLPGGLHVVYMGVPYALSQNILNSSDPDTEIKIQLAGYPRRISA